MRNIFTLLHFVTILVLFSLTTFTPFDSFWWITKFIDRFTVFVGGSSINLFLNFLIDSATRIIILSLTKKSSDPFNLFVAYKVLKVLLSWNFTVFIDSLTILIMSFLSGAGTFCWLSESFWSINCDSFFPYSLLRAWCKLLSFTYTNPVILPPIIT